ncbi:HVA22-like protein k [Camellia lanceoleosa]|uniref:HVA22-like protein k n=1 Tax=Camellia lanceoleosa TaxID=1840588 RepID=A0ACC0IP75_9ERIC|nr:HVA22-like protein k [Camellia lanceoleosa]
MGRIRKKMRGKEVKKLTGCSWVYIENKVHIFTSGDRCHSQAEAIYSILVCLASELNDMVKLKLEIGLGIERNTLAPSFFRSCCFANQFQVGLRLLLCPLDTNIVVRTAWFPLYYHMKFAFLVWLQLPSVNGANHLYMNHLRPFLLRHQAKLDQIVGFLYSEMVKFVSAHQTEIQFVRTLFMKIFGAVNQVVGDFFHPGKKQANRAIEGPTTNVQTQPDSVIESLTTQEQNSESESDE